MLAVANAMGRASASHSPTAPAVCQDRLLNRVAKAKAKAQGRGMCPVVLAELAEHDLHADGHRPDTNAERVRDLLVARFTGDQAEDPPYLSCHFPARAGTDHSGAADDVGTIDGSDNASSAADIAFPSDRRRPAC